MNQATGVKTAIGLMSGTSMDGVDAAVLSSDGMTIHGLGSSLTRGYDRVERHLLREAVAMATPKARTQPPEAVIRAQDMITRVHAEVVHDLLQKNNIRSENIYVIGFHGHTVLHRPNAGWSWQIGDPALLAELTGIDVVSDFRGHDLAAGGQGAPLAPLYHLALAGARMAEVRPIEDWPLAVLNIGGIANVTWIPDPDATAISPEEGLIAFDSGPGNAPIDDWLCAHGAGDMDVGGGLAARGRVDDRALARLMDQPYFTRGLPKSLDRDELETEAVASLSLADGAATLTAWTARAVAVGAGLFPRPARRWLVCGGGRHNRTLMAALAVELRMPVDPVDAWGWRGDALEAEVFAYLAIRARAGLPLSYPGTTGVSRPMTGGRVTRATKD